MKNKEFLTVTYLKEDGTKKNKVISWNLQSAYSKFLLEKKVEFMTEIEFKEWYALQPKTTNRKYYLHQRLKKLNITDLELSVKEKTFNVPVDIVSAITENKYVQQLRAEFDYQIQTCIPQHKEVCTA